MPPREHQELLEEALRTEGEGQRFLLDGRGDAGRAKLREAAELYRRSWEAAPARSFGRLIGMLKAEVIAGEPGRAARYVREQLGEGANSPASWYALGVAALAEGDDELAARSADRMRGASPEFTRAAAALAALAQRDADGYALALEEIVADFESREAHLTGVAIADTAVMFQSLAQERGMAADISSSLLPPQDWELGTGS